MFDNAQFVKRKDGTGLVLTYKKAREAGIPDEELEAGGGYNCGVCGEFRAGVAYLGCRCDRQALDEGRDWQEYAPDDGG